MPAHTWKIALGWLPQGSKHYRTIYFHIRDANAYERTESPAVFEENKGTSTQQAHIYQGGPD